jgi:hypothetical protein
MVFSGIDGDVRVQTRCVLVVRFAWDVAAGDHHPAFSFCCAEDVAMATAMAANAAIIAPRGIRLAAADVSTDGGRTGPWEPLELPDRS